MALQLLVLLLALVVEDQNLRSTAFAENGANDLGVAGCVTEPASPETASTSLNSTVLFSPASAFSILRRRRGRHGIVFRLCG